MRRSPIRRRPRPGGAEYARARQEIYDAATGLCQAGTPDCTGPCEQVHHRQGRDGERYTDRTLLLCVCAACHRYIHGHPAESYERGWMLRRNR